jgi:hypothetical protein
MGTGVLFHVKHRYGEAYEALEVPAVRDVSFVEARISAGELLERGVFRATARPHLVGHPSGVPAWVGEGPEGPAVIDARTGAPIEPSSEEVAVRWAEAAVAASPHRERYGQAGAREPTSEPSAVTGGVHPSVRIAFSGGKHVTVDRLTGGLSQTGALNDFIDLTYRVHYLQWTPWKPVNVALVLIAVPLVLVLAGSGVWLSLRRPLPNRR